MFSRTQIPPVPTHRAICTTTNIHQCLLAVESWGPTTTNRPVFVEGSNSHHNGGPRGDGQTGADGEGKAGQSTDGPKTSSSCSSVLLKSNTLTDKNNNEEAAFCGICHYELLYCQNIDSFCNLILFKMLDRCVYFVFQN